MSWFIFIWFSIAMFISLVLMKCLSLMKAPIGKESVLFFFTSPLLATSTWKRRTVLNKAGLKYIVSRNILSFVAFVLVWWAYLSLIPSLQLSVLGQCYLILLPVYCLIQLFTDLLLLFYSLSGNLYPEAFRYPFLSKNLSDFWSARWNVWVSDFFKQMIFDPLRRKPLVGLFAVFIVSGVVHEILLNVPLYLFAKTNMFGSMMIYFPLQAVAMAVEKKLDLKKGSIVARVYLWIVVVAPAPLVINESVLRMIGVLFES